MEKSLLLCPYFVKSGPFSKKHSALKAILCQKKYILSKKGSEVIFSNLSWKSPFCHAYIWSKNNSAKTTLYNGPKMSLGCPFFQLLTKKSRLSCQLSKNVQYLKKHCSYVHILSRNVICMIKVLSCLFFQNLNDNSPAVMPIFGQKSSILSKLQYIMVTTL